MKAEAKSILANEYKKNRQDLLDALTEEGTSYMAEYAILKLDKTIEQYHQSQLQALKEDIKDSFIDQSSPDPFDGGLLYAYKDVLEKIDKYLEEKC